MDTLLRTPANRFEAPDLHSQAAALAKAPQGQRLDRLLVAFLEGTTDALYLKDLDGQYVLINSAGARFLGTPKEEVLGRTDHDFFARDTAIRIQKNDRDVVVDNQIYTFEHVAEIDGDKKVFFSTKGPYRDEAGVVQGVIGISRDITDRKKAEQALIELNHQLGVLTRRSREINCQLVVPTILRTLVLASLEMVPSRIAACGIQVQGVMRFTEYYTGGEFKPFLSEFERGEGIPGSLLLTGEAYTQNSGPILKHALTSVPGAKNPDSLVSIPIGGRDGRVVGCLEIHDRLGEQGFTDGELLMLSNLAESASVALENARILQELRDAEAKARESLALRDEFLSIAAHELKTPLTTLKLGLSAIQRTIRRDASPTGTVPRQLDLICSQTKRLEVLMNDLLSVSRLREGAIKLNMEHVDFAELLRDVLDRLAEVIKDSGCEVLFRSSGVVPGNFDRSRIEQVIVNLVTNSLKYGLKKQIEIDVWAGHSDVFLRVKDHGIGIRKELQGKIFERFERGVPSEHFGGLGLGLYISRQIVAAHAGTITVESEPGLGSCFTVKLPSRMAGIKE
jgi:PAS domain S-box-containing protein